MLLSFPLMMPYFLYLLLQIVRLFWNCFRCHQVYVYDPRSRDSNMRSLEWQTIGSVRSFGPKTLHELPLSVLVVRTVMAMAEADIAAARDKACAKVAYEAEVAVKDREVRRTASSSTVEARTPQRSASEGTTKRSKEGSFHLIGRHLRNLSAVLGKWKHKNMLRKREAEVGAHRVLHKVKTRQTGFSY